MAHPWAPEGKKTKKTRIAVLEKNPILALDMQKTLQRAGYDAQAVFSSAEAYLAAASVTVFDLLIVERSLRHDLTSATKARNEGLGACEVPFICLATLSDESPDPAKDGPGALGILVKPFSAKDLLGTLEIALYRAKMEKRLSAEEKRYRELFDFSLSPRCLSTPEGRIVESNAAFRSLFSPVENDILLKDFFSSSDWEILEKSLREEKPVQGRELEMKDSREGELKITVSIAEFDDPRYGPLLSWEFFDLTEAQRLREELMQSQKMDALGRLAGGIAHDFNNILTTIVGHAEMLRMDLDVGNPQDKDIEGIGAAASRATRLTRQLLGFSRKQPYKPRVLELSQLLKETEGMLKKLAGEAILFSLRLPSLALPVFIDPIQIEQALMNLVVNARDALQGKPSGSIAVFAHRKTLANTSHLRGRELKAGDYAVISVADTGCGISPAMADKIFDPFFTTKGLHKGTGLGLAIVDSVISSGGGAVEVVSFQGEGSEFRLWLPLVAAGRRNAAPDTEESMDQAQDDSLELPKGLSLLIVDDDEDLLGFLAYATARAGARVNTARNGGEALMLVEKQRFEALVIDVNLPGLNGFALYERLAQAHSTEGLPCIFISGRTVQEEGERSLSESAQGQSKGITGVFPILEKPFTPSQLIRAVKASIGSGEDHTV